VNRLLRDLYNRFYPSLPANSPIQLTLLSGIHHEEVGFDTDPSLLWEILSRLIDNAVKFTRSGVVRFGYDLAPGNAAEFFVEDTGPGIPSSEKENIFLRFYVMETDKKTNRSGPGLGLPVAQHFTALLGGELKVDSTPGKGSRFWFRLPLKNPRGFMQVVQ
jgi:signal transduction histidine kinase